MIQEREVVAIRTEGPHEHITMVKRETGDVESAQMVIEAIQGHAAHYFMDRPDGKLLLRVQQCPDCREEVLWA